MYCFTKDIEKCNFIVLWILFLIVKQRQYKEFPWNKLLKFKSQLLSKYRGAEPLKFFARLQLVNHAPSITFRLSVGMFSQRHRRSGKYIITSQCDGLWQTHFFVSLPLWCLTKWIQTGWHLFFKSVLSNVHFLPSWPATTLPTNWLLWLILSFVRSVPASGPCHCGLAHGL